MKNITKLAQRVSYVGDTVSVRASKYNKQDWYLKKGDQEVVSLEVSLGKNTVDFYYSTMTSKDYLNHDIETTVDTIHQGEITEIYQEYPDGTEISIIKSVKVGSYLISYENKDGLTTFQKKLRSGGVKFKQDGAEFNVRINGDTLTLTRKRQSGKAEFVFNLVTGRIVLKSFRKGNASQKRDKIGQKVLSKKTFSKEIQGNLLDNSNYKSNKNLNIDFNALTKNKKAEVLPQTNDKTSGFSFWGILGVLVGTIMMCLSGGKINEKK